MEIISGFFACNLSESAGKRFANTLGFTAKTTTSEAATNASLFSAAITPSVLSSAAVLALSMSDTKISEAENAPEETAPLIMALAMLPAPINPIFIKSFLC